MDMITLALAKAYSDSKGLCSNPANYGLPVLALTGDTSAMTKDNAVTLDY